MYIYIYCIYNIVREKQEGTRGGASGNKCCLFPYFSRAEYLSCCYSCIGKILVYDGYSDVCGQFGLCGIAIMVNQAAASVKWMAPRIWAERKSNSQIIRKELVQCPYISPFSLLRSKALAFCSFIFLHWILLRPRDGCTRKDSKFSQREASASSSKPSGPDWKTFADWRPTRGAVFTACLMEGDLLHIQL